MKRTRTLGLIVTDIQNPFFPELVQAADLAARSLDYSIILGSAAYDETGRCTTWTSWSTAGSTG